MRLCSTTLLLMYVLFQVIFNCIDYGEYFDYAVVSLCTSLSLPYITASSYGHTSIVECYPPLAVPQNGKQLCYILIV